MTLPPVFRVSRRSAIRSAEPFTQPKTRTNPKARGSTLDWGKPRKLAGVKGTTDQKVGGSNPSGRARQIPLNRRKCCGERAVSSSRLCQGSRWLLFWSRTRRGIVSVIRQLRCLSKLATPMFKPGVNTSTVAKPFAQSQPAQLAPISPKVVEISLRFQRDRLRQLRGR